MLFTQTRSMKKVARFWKGVFVYPRILKGKITIIAVESAKVCNHVILREG